jgi:hypothetical protein
MPYNIPSTGSTATISFGPAEVFLGPSGSTPTVNLGFVTEDGAVSLEIQSEKTHIRQGNPKTIEYTFSNAQGYRLVFNSIEWLVAERFADALGAGVTASSSPQDTFEFGGDPIVRTLAAHVRHYMAPAGHTLNAYLWKVVGDGNLSSSFTDGAHSREMGFVGQRAATNWGGVSLTGTKQLLQILKQK